MEFLEAKAIAERLGFQLFADVRGDTNALRLFTEDFRQKYGKKYRCGVYMQFRADGSCYIGQSLDVDRRHKRHRELGVIVDYLAFRCWPPSVLMEKEDLCIQDALALGVPLVNKTLKCGTLKKSDDYSRQMSRTCSSSGSQPARRRSPSGRTSARTRNDLSFVTGRFSASIRGSWSSTRRQPFI